MNFTGNIILKKNLYLSLYSYFFACIFFTAKIDQENEEKSLTEAHKR